MTEGELIVIAIRLTVPLLIFRYTLLGGLAAVAVDALDVVIIEVIGLGGFGGHYSQLDKALDTYYLTIELVVAWGWVNPWTRIPAIVFYAHRVLGVILFEFTGRDGSCSSSPTCSRIGGCTASRSLGSRPNGLPVPGRPCSRPLAPCSRPSSLRNISCTTWRPSPGTGSSGMSWARTNRSHRRHRMA